MRFTSSISMFVALGLSGCATISRPVETLPITAKEIFHAVDCELKDLTQRPQLQATTLKNWTGLSNIKVLNTGNLQLGSEAGFTTTVKTALAPITVKATPSGGYSDKTVGTLQLARNYDTLSMLADESCATSYALGLTEVFEGQLAFAGNDPSSKEITDLSFQRTYTVNRTIGGGLSFTVGSWKITADGNKASGQVETTISVTIQPPKPKSSTPASAPAATPREEMQQRLDQLSRDEQQRAITLAVEGVGDES